MLNSLKARFDTKYTVAETGCWLWTGATIRVATGFYGTMRDGSSRMTPAHRISYMIYRGDIPDGFEVDHLCQNKLCVNPDHLLARPPSDNRINPTLRCKKGHYNWGHTKRGWRYCVECDKEAHRRKRVSVS